ncbi:MAG: hypothetical protein KUG77_04120, partial [Nannocystaceae bacterium]|nr:hypothetical protein [Nannocystaceae bacterium]
DDSDDSSGPSLPTAGGDDGSMGDDSSGGDTPSSACESYCVAELSCDTFYDSQVECAQECEEGRIDAGDCAPSLDGLNTCLGLLSCDDFFEFWYAISAIEMGESTGDFPCVDEFIDYGVCLEGTGV